LARIYNREDVFFCARPVGKPRDGFLSGVEFLLYDEGGDPARSEDVRMRVGGERRWGEPPSCLRYPPEDLIIPIGRYRLLARKKGWRSDEVKVVIARFGYRRTATEHGKASYRTAFSLHLSDATESRKTVPVTVRILDRAGALIDEGSATLRPLAKKGWRYETTKVVRLSSSLRRPDRELPVADRKGVLKLLPGCRLELVLGSRRFEYPVPLASGRVTREREMEEGDRLKNKDGVADKVGPGMTPKGRRGAGRAPGGPR